MKKLLLAAIIITAFVSYTFIYTCSHAPDNCDSPREHRDKLRELPPPY